MPNCVFRSFCFIHWHFHLILMKLMLKSLKTIVHLEYLQVKYFSSIRLAKNFDFSLKKILSNAFPPHAHIQSKQL